MLNLTVKQVVSGIVLGLLLGEFAAAQENHEGDHAPLATSESLTFSSVFEAALTNAPESIAGPVRRQQAEDYADSAKSWITGRPSWEINYIDDGVLDDVGLREIESGVQVNLWRPGERRHAQRLGQSYGLQAQAWTNYLQLLVAGRVRANLAAITRAQAMLELERRATTNTEQLLDISQQMFESGAIPQLDVLQAQSLLLQQRKIEFDAEAELVDAEREYSVLTNMQMRPARAHSEVQSTLEEIPASHPTLRFLRSGIELAQANIGKLKRESSGSPTMMFGVRRERGDRLHPYTDSLGVSFSIPFGGGASVSADVSNARRGEVDAEIQLLATRRKLNAQLHEVEHELFLINQSLQLSESQTAITQQRYQMAIAAFESGETDLTQVIIALQQANASEMELEGLRLSRQSLITEYNQTIGILP